MDRLVTTAPAKGGSFKANQHIHFTTNTDAIEQFRNAMLNVIGYAPENIIGDSVLTIKISKSGNVGNVGNIDLKESAPKEKNTKNSAANDVEVF
jgi:hypothetical protein